MAVDIDLLNSNSLDNIQANFGRVQTALQDAVSRSGNTPNQMNADFDMNGNDILNVGELDADSISINGLPIGQFNGTFKGLWSSVTNYVVNDVVRDSLGNLWIAKQSSLNQTPAENAYWTIFIPVVNAVTDGDKGDITVSGGGATWSLDNDTITRNKIVPAVNASIKINVKEYGAVGDGVTDDYTAIQNTIDAVKALGGGTVYLPHGDYKINTSLLIDAPYITFLLEDSTQITHDTSDFMALQITGNYCSVKGGIQRGFVGPAAWDPVDGSGSLTYAVIRFTGEQGLVQGTRIFNIRRVGIQFKDVNNGRVEDCWIEGNQPYPTFPLTLTNHHGIHFDAGTEASWGNYRASNNTIKTCTQGIDLASFGGGGGSSGEAHGCVISNNTFEDIWDHAIYTNYADGCVITGNNFSDCHVAVAASGPRHVISGNSFVARGTGSVENNVPGISLRDPQYCVVSDNSFFGVATAVSPVHIDFRVLSADVCYNVVANNTIRIAAGSSTAIRFSYLNDTNYSIYDNIVEGNNIIALGRSTTEGVIQFEGNTTASGILNTGNIIRGNRISQRGNSPGIYLTNIVASLIEGNITKLEYGHGSAVNLDAIRLETCTDVVVASNTYIVPPGQGANIAYRGLRESGTCLRNETRHNRSYVNTAASGFTFAEFNPASGSSQLLAIYAGTGAPGAAVRAGSQYIRYDGGTGTCFYVNEADGVNWVAK